MYSFLLAVASISLMQKFILVDEMLACEILFSLVIFYCFFSVNRQFDDYCGLQDGG